MDNNPNSTGAIIIGIIIVLIVIVGGYYLFSSGSPTNSLNTTGTTQTPVGSGTTGY